MPKEVGYNSHYDDSNDFIWDKMWERVWGMSTPFVLTFSVETGSNFSDIKFESSPQQLAECSDISQDFYSGLYHLGNMVYVAYRQNTSGTRRMWIRIAAPSEIQVESVQKLIVGQLVPIEQDEDAVKVRFWHWTGHSGDYNIRYLDAPEWTEIKDNYSSTVRDDLEKFVNLQPEDIAGGRLAIIHGPPGTGKTTMIRALCREWKKWCNIDYIIDPEQFFGNAQYMTSTLMAKEEKSYAPLNPFEAYDDYDDDEVAIERIFDRANGRSAGTISSPSWRLLVIEDAEDFVNPNAKENVGQALSRLLNVGDGFIGQGLNILILLTTNTKLDDVHDAVKRPGRCFANIGVPAMTSSEASEWLGSTVDNEKTLAELFERKRTIGHQIGQGVKQNKRTGQYL